MSKEKLLSLTKYYNELKNRSESKEVPSKHAGSETTYRAYLANEIRMVTSKIETLKMGVK